MTTPIPPLDLMWLLFESPVGTTHVGAMMLFKKPQGGRSAVREIVDAYRRYRPTPPFNYVPDLVSGGAPHFREVDHWDPQYHVQHLALPAGGSYEDLLRLVADLHEPMLDRDRPLFRCWVIDGVPGGRFAIYSKTHHCVLDGVSGLKMLYAGLSLSDEHTVPEPAFALRRRPPDPRPSPSFVQRVTDPIRGALAEVGAINQVSLGVLRKTLTGLFASHFEGNLPFTAQRSVINKPLQRGRKFATLSLPLDEMHEIAGHFGGTLNDVALGVVDAGLHAYLRESGQPFAHRFVAMCPVSLRDDGDLTLGTRASAMCVRLGEPEAGASVRIRQVIDSVAAAKKELHQISTDAAMIYAAGIGVLASLAASTHLDRVGRLACNLVISNVPGARETRYLNGARLLGVYPVSALGASIGLNVTLSSYSDQMDFGFVANAAAIDDVSALAGCTRSAYGELKAAATAVVPISGS